MTDAPDSDVTEDDAAEPLVEMAYGAISTVDRDQEVLFCDVESYYAVVGALLADGFNMLIDLTAVDYSAIASRPLPPGLSADRFELVVTFRSHAQRRRVRLRVQLDGESPTAPSLYRLYPGCDYLEREVYDMFGIAFDGHPDLSRILMPETWVGHPLRKDYDVGRIPVQFKGAPTAR